MQKKEEEQKKVIVFVSGGVVQDVLAESAVDLIVVDHDTDGTEAKAKVNDRACDISWWKLDGVKTVAEKKTIAEIVREWKKLDRR